ncbi:DUF5658 family protein [Mesobacillus selenatarsenatis]|uniref:DUF5658 domain-containing protein n=1 Tax=Mesobacillus selenatarsenatis TaxID=388741 RepID=A0A846TL05_9BACI|nr:DUF5658 family protein [Mesobacillus selenatarsenatis]NKE07459.1 hypothetical protein [Mesobacillus selenatarsenatis]
MNVNSAICLGKLWIVLISSEVIPLTLLFYYLITLNLFDAAVTWIGLENSFISELNPFMHAMYEINPFLFILIKVTLSIFLFLFVLFKVVPQSTLIKGITVFASAAYTAVVFMHVFWLVLVF